jgi:hypothetical protein
MPILIAGFYSDDALNSLIKGNILYDHTALFSVIWREIVKWAHSRFFPVILFLQYQFYYVFSNVIAYQIARVISIWASYLTFAWLLKEISKKEGVGILFLLFIPFFWSIRDFHDPFTSFGILLPFVTAMMGLALVCYLKFINTNKLHWQIASACTYICAILSYEIGIVTVLMMMILGGLRLPSFKKWLISLMPVAIITFVYLIIYGLIHYLSTEMYDGMVLGSTSKLIATWGAQLSATLPLSYRLFAHEPALAASVLVKNVFNDPYLGSVIVYLFLTLLGLYYYFIKKLALTRSQVFCIISLGIALTVIPAGLIAASKKYQNLVSVGIGYLPVYIQIVGANFILIGLLGLLNRVLVNKIRLVQYVAYFLLATFCSLVTCFVLIFNMQIVQKVNNDWQNPRILVEKASAFGLFDELPNNSTIVSQNHTFTSHNFFMQYAKKRVNFLDLLKLKEDGQVAAFSKNLIKVTDPNYMLMAFDHLSFSSDGYIFLGQLRFADLQRIAPGIEKKGYAIYDPKLFILSRSADSFPMLTDAIINCFSPIYYPTEGFYGVERDTVSEWLWSNKTSTLHIVNMEPQPILAEVNFELQTRSKEFTRISLSGKLIQGSYLVNKEAVTVHKTVRLEPGAHAIHFLAEGNYFPDKHDPRNLYFLIKNLTITTPKKSHVLNEIKKASLKKEAVINLHGEYWIHYPDKPTIPK